VPSHNSLGRRLSIIDYRSDRVTAVAPFGACTLFTEPPMLGRTLEKEGTNVGPVLLKGGTSRTAVN
jgi:hypothetical protein